MKKFFMVTVAICGMMATNGYAQVGMPTNNPNKDAVLDLNRTDGTSAKGLLLPKVALMAVNRFEPMTAHVAGMHVWNTVTAGTGINVVTPGEYYNDGSKWIRVSSATDAWIQDGNSNGAIKKIGTNDAFDLPIETNGVERMRVTSGGKIGIGTNAPNATLDIRPNPSSTSNPGVAFLGIGTTAVAANSAGAGAVRYSTGSGGVLEYSNGVVWNQLSSTAVRAIVVAKKTSVQTFPSSTATGAAVTDWVEQIDNSNAFNAATGVFTAPRNGEYSISFSYAFLYGPVVSGGEVQAVISVNNNSPATKKNTIGFPAAGSSTVGCSITYVIPLNAGDTISPIIWHSTGQTKSLLVYDIGSAYNNDGFVCFSVAEL